MLQLDPSWRQIKGNWEVEGGLLVGREIVSDRHAAVIGRRIDGRNLLIRFNVLVDDKAAHVSLGLDTENGHICRVDFRSDLIQIGKPDQDGSAGPDTKLWWHEPTDAIRVGQWHSVVIEVLENEMLVGFDGKKFLYASSDALDQPIPKVYLDLRAHGEVRFIQ